MTPAPDSRRVLVDTSAYYALVDAADSNHGAARSIINDLAQKRYRLFTTNFILAETHALLLSRLGRTIAQRALIEIERGSTTVVRLRATDERRAREIIVRYQDKDFTLTDASSFAVMERLRISIAFTFDHHFVQYGYTMAMPDAAS